MAPLLGGLSLCGLGCDSELITLGQIIEGGGAQAGAGGAPGAGGTAGAGGGAAAGSGAGGVGPDFTLGEPVLVAGLESSNKDDNATFTDDLLEVYFTSERGEGDKLDVWYAKRTSLSEAFATPERVTAVSSAEEESSPAISLDGRTLWFGTKRAGDDFDVWVSSRSDRSANWPEPSEVSELNSDEDDIPRPLGLNETTMPLGSRRTNGTYLTFFASRASETAGFGAPVLRSDLVFGESTTVDAFLTADGLALFYSSDASGRTDLYVARRRSVMDNFEAPTPLEALNTVDSDEKDPWLSPDGRWFFFTSDRSGGDYAIYQVPVIR